MQLIHHVTSLSFFNSCDGRNAGIWARQRDAHDMSHNHCLYITFYPFAFLTGAKLIMFAHLSLQNRQVANKVRFERTPLCTVSLLSHLATGHFGGFWYYNVLALFRITVVPILAKSHWIEYYPVIRDKLAVEHAKDLLRPFFCYAANQQPFPCIEVMQISIFTSICSEALLMIPQVYSYHIISRKWWFRFTSHTLYFLYHYSCPWASITLKILRLYLPTIRCFIFVKRDKYKWSRRGSLRVFACYFFKLNICILLTMSYNVTETSTQLYRLTLMSERRAKWMLFTDGNLLLKIFSETCHVRCSPGFQQSYEHLDSSLSSFRRRNNADVCSSWP